VVAEMTADREEAARVAVGERSWWWRRPLLLDESQILPETRSAVPLSAVRGPPPHSPYKKHRWRQIRQSGQSSVWCSLTWSPEGQTGPPAPG
jgi:hypothetical protein